MKNWLELRDCPGMAGAPDIGSCPRWDETSGGRDWEGVAPPLYNGICVEVGKICGARSFPESERIFFLRCPPGAKGTWVKKGLGFCKGVEVTLNIDDFSAIDDDVRGCLSLGDNFDIMDGTVGREVFNSSNGLRVEGANVAGSSKVRGV
jgi:hypothetical protein